MQWMLSTVFDSISPVFLLTLYLYTMTVSSSVVANLKLLMAHPLPTGNHCNTRDMAASGAERFQNGWSKLSVSGS